MPSSVFSVIQISIDTFGVWLFCSIVAVFIVPLVLDRIIFYIPRLISLRRKNQVLTKSIPVTIFDVMLWVVIIAGIYVYLYLFAPDYFVATTVSPPAILAWVIGAARLIYRFANFDQTTKKQFYYNAYMRYITPEAYAEYRTFLEDLDSMDLEEMNTILENPELPYMQRQSVLRRQREARMVLLMSSQTS